MRRAGVMNVWWSVCAMVALLAAPQASVWAQEPVQAAATEASEQTVTGRLIAEWCVLNEGSLCLNKDYTSTARNCVRMGSPLALLVGEEKREGKHYKVYQNYGVYHLATPASALKLKMANWMNAQVTVRGPLEIRNGQRYLVVSHAERVD